MSVLPKGDELTPTARRGSTQKATGNQSIASFADLVLEASRTRSRQTAFRFKKLGAWHDVSWLEVHEASRRIGAGLNRLGIQPGHVVVVAAPPTREWIWAFLGVHLSGAIPLMLYQRLGLPRLLSLLARESPAAAIAEVGWMEMLAEAGANLPKVTLFTDRRRPAEWSGGAVRMLADLSVANDKSDDGAMSAAVHDTFLFATPGTTGPPKIVAHSTRSLMAAARALADAASTDRVLGPHDSLVVEIPTGHPAAVVSAVALPLATGLVAHLPETTQSMPFREVRPTVSLNVSLPWERRAARLAVAAQTGRGLKRKVLLAVERSARNASGRSGASLVRVLRNSIVHFFVLLPLLSTLGIERVRAAFVIGRIDDTILTFWRRLGVPLTSAYGLTETGPLVATTWGSALEPALEHAVSTDRDGSVLVRGESLFLGYWDRGQLQSLVDHREPFTTDDVGTTGKNPRLVGHRLFSRDFGTGRTVSFEEVDCVLRLSPYVSHACTFESSGGTLTALVDLDFRCLARWATAAGVAYRSPNALLASEPVSQLLRTELESANRRLREAGLPAVHMMTTAPRPFLWGDELTPLGIVRPDAIVKAAAIGPSEPDQIAIVAE